MGDPSVGVVYHQIGVYPIGQGKVAMAAGNSAVEGVVVGVGRIGVAAVLHGHAVGVAGRTRCGGGNTVRRIGYGIVVPRCCAGVRAGFRLFAAEGVVSPRGGESVGAGQRGDTAKPWIIEMRFRLAQRVGHLQRKPSGAVRRAGVAGRGGARGNQSRAARGRCRRFRPRAVAIARGDRGLVAKGVVCVYGCQAILRTPRLDDLFQQQPRRRIVYKCRTPR